MPHEIALAVASDAIAKDEIVHPTADVDRVDLNITEMFEGMVDASDRFIEQHSTTVKTTCHRRSQGERSRHHGGRTLDCILQKTSRAAESAARLEGANNQS
jgi:hypothetical protein